MGHFALFTPILHLLSRQLSVQRFGDIDAAAAQGLTAGGVHRGDVPAFLSQLSLNFGGAWVRAWQVHFLHWEAISRPHLQDLLDPLALVFAADAEVWVGQDLLPVVWSQVHDFVDVTGGCALGGRRVPELVFVHRFSDSLVVVLWSGAEAHLHLSHRATRRAASARPRLSDGLRHRVRVIQYAVFAQVVPHVHVLADVGGGE